jgi:hypothetical protein
MLQLYRENKQNGATEAAPYFCNEPLYFFFFFGTDFFAGAAFFAGLTFAGLARADFFAAFATGFGAFCDSGFDAFFGASFVACLDDGAADLAGAAAGLAAGFVNGSPAAGASFASFFVC